jgi:hypothetical protein
MAHFSGQQFIAFFGLLPSGHVQKYPEHLAFVQGLSRHPNRAPKPI